MADFVYDKARQHYSQADINYPSDNIKFCLVNATAGAGYTPSQANDEFLSIIPTACRTAFTGNFTSKTNVAGVHDADDPKFTAVAVGPANQMIVMFKDTGNAATSILIAHIDSYAGLPVTPTGVDILVVLPNDVNKIFQL
jgi:hypothetical protein